MPTKKTTTSFSKKILKILLFIVFLLLTAHISLQYINWEVYYQQAGSIYELANRFDLDDEASVATWFSQLMFLSIAALAFLAAYLQPKSQQKKLWKLIGVSTLIASIDEIAGLHEYTLQTIHNTFFRDQAPTEFGNAWLVILPIILAAAGWLIYKIYRLLDRRTVLIFSIAIGIFLVGAVVVDQITSLTERESFLHQGILVAVEEALELIATVLIIYAIASYIETHHRAQIMRSINALKQ